MKNIEKINSLLTDVQKLESLLIDNKRTEAYTISFFSQAFKVTYNMLVQLQALEQEQLEAFRLQLETHQSILERLMATHPISEDIDVSKDLFINKSEESVIVNPIEHREEIIPCSEVSTKYDAEATESTFSKKETISTVDLVTEEPINNTVDNIVDNSVDSANTSTNINATIVSKTVRPDIKKIFTLIDLFYFRRELFKGNEQLMNKSIDVLNNANSLSDAITYIREELKWDFESDATKKFITLLEARYA